MPVPTPPPLGVHPMKNPRFMLRPQRPLSTRSGHRTGASGIRSPNGRVPSGTGAHSGIEPLSHSRGRNGMKSGMASNSIFSSPSFSAKTESPGGYVDTSSLTLIRIASRLVFHSKLSCRVTSSHLPASQGLPRARANRQPLKIRTVIGTEGMSRSFNTHSMTPGGRSKSKNSAKAS
jgi:hypothetical protein